MGMDTVQKPLQLEAEALETNSSKRKKVRCSSASSLFSGTKEKLIA